MTIAVVTGGRDYRPTPADAWALRAALLLHGVALVRHGGCRGVDEWARRVCGRLGIETEAWPADWSRGRRAGPERNRAMLDGPPVAGVVVALPGGSGTADCVRAARERGIPVVRIER